MGICLQVYGFYSNYRLLCAFLKKVYSLTRKQSSLILQIRCSHFPLNAYLYRVNKMDTDKCQACANDQEDIPPVETINHFVFDCPSYTDARNELIEDIGREEFHLSNIMFNTDRMKALINFINRTGRFRA